MKSYFRNLKQSFINFYQYFNIIWNDRDWDYNFTLLLLKFKLTRQAKYLRQFGHLENSLRYAIEIDKAVDLLDKFKERYYEDCDLKEVLDYMRVTDLSLTYDFKKEYNLRCDAHEKCKKELFNLISNRIEFWWT